jgi:nucleoside-diphosphate-sugar epimerase
MSKHVVFGAGGALGAAIVQNLVEQNKSVRAVVRDVGRARKVLLSSAEIVAADASKREDIKPAFQDVSVVYHCVNVPYDKWTEVMPLVTDNILAGAIEKQANVIFPGNVYVYGRFQRIPAPEDHPLAATSKKGKLRIGLEKELMDAVDALVIDGYSPEGIITVIDREDERNTLRNGVLKYYSLFKHSEFEGFIKAKKQEQKVN